MGIRFWCPNGHKLNVKTFQAGRRGICPYCGAKFQIPMESTRKPGAKDLVSEPHEHSVHEGGGGTPPGAGPAAQPLGPGLIDMTAAAAKGDHTVASAPSQGLDDVPPSERVFFPAAGPSGAEFGRPEGGAMGLLQPQGSDAPGGAAAGPVPEPPSVGGPQTLYQSAPAAPLAPAAPAGAVDPLAEAADVVWYVRPPTGGQFGPATSDVMRNWIEEGRVSPDSLVWREGWRDWQEAAAVFAQPGADEPGIGGFVTQPASGEARGPAAPRRGPSRATSAIIIGVLVLAVIVLFVVFLYVAFGPQPGKTGRSRFQGATTISLAEHVATGSLGRAADQHA